MHRRHQLHIGPNLHIITDSDRRDVQGHQTEVDERPGTDADMAAVVHPQRQPDLRALTDGPSSSVSSRRRFCGSRADVAFNASIRSMARRLCSASSGSSATYRSPVSIRSRMEQLSESGAMPTIVHTEADRHTGRAGTATTTTAARWRRTWAYARRRRPRQREPSPAGSAEPNGGPCPPGVRQVDTLIA